LTENDPRFEPYGEFGPAHFAEPAAGRGRESTVRVPPQRAPEPAEVARDLRFAEISGMPAPEPEPGRFHVGRLLRRCAGVSETLLAWVPTDRPRYTGMGGFVLFTALMAIGSSTIALTIAFDRPWPYVVLPAIFWGVLIFNLDRWIVASPLPEHGFRRVAVFLPRLLMSVIFAVVIAEPVLLIVFKTAVNEQLQKIRTDEASAYQRQLEECNPAPTPNDPRCKDRILTRSTAVQTAQGTVDAAQAAADGSDRQLRTADADLQKATREMTSECRGQAEARKSAAAARADSSTATATDDDDDDAPAAATPAAATPAADGEAGPNPIRLSHIQVLLARAAEQRHDDAAATQWLSRIDPKDVDLQVVALRSTILARQGKLAEARALVHGAPAATPAEERYRLLTEVQLLLDAKKLEDARKLLAQTNAANPDDVDLIYQEAMVNERLNRLDDMERLLRRILVLQPNNSQALNALGYSLADRNLRLDEALGLVRQAHELSPTDPFIVDSLGWVLFRMGQYTEATALLNQAYTSRKDTEIAAHLGEVLWADGKHEEATRVLREAARRDGGNEVLKQTMARLKVTP